MRVVVVGGGLAGLTCARSLLRSDVDVLVLEKSDEPGGRVRSETVDGYVIDHGFQVLFTAYPAARRLLDLAALNLRAFDPGALIAHGSVRHVLSDPARDPEALLGSLLTTIVPAADKWRTWRLSGEVGAKPLSALLDGPDQTTERFLKRRGFSDEYIDRFARPFFGGIFLDRSLATSARTFQFVWKMLAEGDTVVPAHGMGEISRQLARELDDDGRIRRATGVNSLNFRTDGRVAGVITDSGEVIEADTVVIATPAPEAARLTGVSTPTGALGCTSLWLSTPAPLWRGKKIVLNANLNPLVNQVAPMSAVAPEYAPPGRHLVCATALGVPDGDDSELTDAFIDDLRRMFTGEKNAAEILDASQPIALQRIPYAQFPQPRGIAATLPDNVTHIPGVVFAAEFTHASSLNAALHSGEKAAGLVLGTGR